MFRALSFTIATVCVAGCYSAPRVGVEPEERPSTVVAETAEWGALFWLIRSPRNAAQMCPDGPAVATTRGVTFTDIALAYITVGLFTPFHSGAVCSTTWTPEVVAAVRLKQVAVGMTPAMARAAWGEPRYINRTVTAHGASEQWVYGLGRYVYVENGVVTAIQN